MTNKLWRVARWEFVERVKTKSFLIGIILTPVIMVLFSVVPSLLMMKGDEESRKLAVYDGTGLLFDSLQSRFRKEYVLDNGKPTYELIRLTGDGKQLDPLRQRVDRDILDEKIEAALFIPSDAFDSLQMEYRGVNVANIRELDRFEKILSQLISNYKLTREGMNPHKIESLIRDVWLRTVRVSEKGVVEESEKGEGFLKQFGISYLFIIMMLIMILQSGQILVRSLLEEKSNRLVEVLVSSCSPIELMAGKILGLGALGLTQISIWVVMAATMVMSVGITDLPLENVPLMLVYFFLGYILYSGIFVAFGTLVSTEQEAQQVTGYLSMILVIPIALSFFATQSPNATIIKVLSFIPLITPAMMVLRIPIQLPSFWEIFATLLILSLTVVFVVWAAGKIFRVGILLTGKRPSIDEIVRWIRG